MSIDLNNLDAVVASFEEIAAEKGPDYVYPAQPAVGVRGNADWSPSCHYVRDNAPSCIVGHFILKHDLLTLAELSQREGNGASEVLTDATVSSAVSVFLDEVQTRQDEGTPWGDAVEVAARIVRGDYDY